MVFQTLEANTFPEIIVKMIEYNNKYKSKHVEFDEPRLDKRSNCWKSSLSREGLIDDSKSIK